MPIATGGGSKPKPKPKPKPAPQYTGTETGLGGNQGTKTTAQLQKQNQTTPPATDTSVGGNTGISKAAKEARQHRQSEAKHAARRRLESKREQMEKGKGRAKYGTEAGDGTRSTAGDIIRSKRAFVQAGGRTKYGGKPGAMRAADKAIGGVRDSNRSGVTGRTGSTRRPSTGGRTGGGGGFDAGGSRFVRGPIGDRGPGIPRTDGGRVGGPRPPTSTGGGTRVGGGFGRPGTEKLPTGAGAFFDGGGGAGGGAGASASALSGVSSASLKERSLEEVLHGAKRKGRIRRTRGTE